MALAQGTQLTILTPQRLWSLALGLSSCRFSHKPLLDASGLCPMAHMGIPTWQTGRSDRLVLISLAQITEMFPRQQGSRRITGPLRAALRACGRRRSTQTITILLLKYRRECNRFSTELWQTKEFTLAEFGPFFPT